MSIITLFDKSFIQSLTVDESVWFDRFFMPVVCPIFYVETLVDLSKTPRDDRSAESEARIIASKFPEKKDRRDVDELMTGQNEAQRSDGTSLPTIPRDIIMTA